MNNVRRISVLSSIAGLSALPLVVIDLGFASKRKSSGVWWDGLPAPGGVRPPVRRTFSDACSLVASLVAGVSGSVALLLECPLSGYLNARGNPEARWPGEARWYVQSGAAVALGGMFFLERLSSGLPAAASVLLAEVYSTGKPVGGWCDACEAEAIGQGVRTASPTITVLQTAAGCAPLLPTVVSQAPIVLEFKPVAAIRARGQCKTH